MRVTSERRVVIGAWRFLPAILAFELGGAPESAARDRTAAPSGATDPFSDATVLELRIEIPEKGVESLRNDQRAYVRAVLREGETTWKDVAVRIKGSAGSYRPVDSEKPGFTVKMNQFVPSARFHGERKFLLNNAAQDPSYLSEMLGNELFRAAGVPAARATFAHVELNGRDLGLFVMMEAVSRDFLSRQFESPVGNLYEGPGDVNSEIDSDSRGIFLDREDLRMLSNAAEERDARERMRRLREVLDVDRFVSFLAMEAITWHWDGYGVGVNNYRIYDDPTTGRMVFMPHGSDQLFQDPNGPLVPEIQGLVARSVLAAPEGQKLYRERLEALVAQQLDADAFQRRAQSLAARLRPVLARRSEQEAQEHDGAVENLVSHVRQRIQSVKEQLADGSGLFGAPLEFDAQGVARLTGWKPRGDRGSPELVIDEQDSESGVAGARRILRIQAGAEDGCVASWRTKVLLAPGSYRFSGRIRTKGLAGLESDAGDRPSGAALRISGQHPRKGQILEDSDWRAFTFDFRVDSDGARQEGVEKEAGDAPAPVENADGGPPAFFQVQLVCELRAEKGTAWFDADSLQLARR
jgi:spore coat protein H